MCYVINEGIENKCAFVIFMEKNKGIIHFYKSYEYGLVKRVSLSRKQIVQSRLGIKRLLGLLF